MAKAVKAKKENSEPKKVGRQTDYDEKTVSIILAWLKDGSTRTAAYGAAGISHQTFYRWLDEKSEFSEAVTRAEAECEALMAQTMKRAATGDWRAAESWLKRRRREEWGDNIKQDVDATLKQKSADDYTDDELVSLIPTN